MYLRQGLLPSSFSSGLCATTAIAVCSRLLGVWWVCIRGKEPPRPTMDGSVGHERLLVPSSRSEMVPLTTGSCSQSRAHLTWFRYSAYTQSMFPLWPVWLVRVHSSNNVALSPVLAARETQRRQQLFQNINSTRRVPGYKAASRWHTGRQGPYVPSLPWGLCHGTMCMVYSGE